MPNKSVYTYVFSITSLKGIVILEFKKFKYKSQNISKSSRF